MLTIEVQGDQALIARLSAMPSRVHEALLRKVTALDLLLEAKVKDKLSGDVLQVRTGALRRSIFGCVQDAPTWVVGRVQSSGDVKYAGIHEFGGTTPAHDIVATKAKALAFMMGGKQVFFKSVHHPGSKIPERSYMRSSLADMRDAIVEGMTEAVRKGAGL
jgi:phage gpG-like protein